MDDGDRGAQLVRGERDELALQLVGLLERDARLVLLHEEPFARARARRATEASAEARTLPRRRTGRRGRPTTSDRDVNGTRRRPRLRSLAIDSSGSTPYVPRTRSCSSRRRLRVLRRPGGICGSTRPDLRRLGGETNSSSIPCAQDFSLGPPPDLAEGVRRREAAEEEEHARRGSGGPRQLHRTPGGRRRPCPASTSTRLSAIAPTASSRTR